MSPSERARLAVFIFLVLGVYITAVWLGSRWWLERAGRVARSGRGERWMRRAALSLAGLGLLCFAHGYWIEPYWLEVTRVRLATPKLVPGTRPIRLVHISDLHSDPAPRLEERLPDVIAAEKPDLIVFTGDSVNSRKGLPVFKRCLGRIARIAPTFVVKGNWDTPWVDLDLFGGTGVRELDGKAVRTEVAGNAIWIAGAAARDEVQIQAALAGAPDDAFTVFLHHYPDEIHRVAERGVDLYCAGHTHGGQVALPFYGAIITLSRFGKRFEAGLYRVGKTWLYVNRGIGMEGARMPRVRFCARPEVTVIEVAPGASPGGPSGMSLPK